MANAGAGHALEDFFSESDEDNTAEGRALKRAEEERQRIAMFRKASVDTDNTGSDDDAPAGIVLICHWTPWVVCVLACVWECVRVRGSVGVYESLSVFFGLCESARLCWHVCEPS